MLKPFAFTARSACLELVTGAKGTTGAAEVVPKPAAWTPNPHAPGAKMTVVTLTPSNYMYIYRERERERIYRKI